MTDLTWINNNTSSANVLYLYVNGSSQLVASLIQSVPISGFGNWDGTLTPTGQSLSSLKAKVSEFVNEAGFPWVEVGDVTAVSGSVMAINLAKVVAINAAGNGLAVNGSGDYTGGFAPYADYASAKAELLELMGKYSF